MADSEASQSQADNIEIPESETKPIEDASSSAAASASANSIQQPSEIVDIPVQELSISELSLEDSPSSHNAQSVPSFSSSGPANQAPSSPIPVSDILSMAADDLLKDFKGEMPPRVSESMAQEIVSMINGADISEILKTQYDALTKMHDLNGKFSEFNAATESRFTVMAQRYQSHTRLLKDMKKDLDDITKRVRTLKSKILPRVVVEQNK